MKAVKKCSEPDFLPKYIKSNYYIKSYRCFEIMEFSIRSMKGLIRENTQKRVSEESAEGLGNFLDKWSEDVAEDAVEIAAEDNRKTVRAEDVRKALNRRKSRSVEEKITI